MSLALPAFDEVRALSCPLEQVVPADFADANGHMNIVRYMELHNEAVWRHMTLFRLGEHHAAAGETSTFQVEHHLHYLREVRVGDRVAVHIRLLGRSERALHTMQFLLNLDRAEIANTLEKISVGVDLATRRSAPFPVEVTELLDAQLKVDQALAWPVPLAGPMRPR